MGDNTQTEQSLEESGPIEEAQEDTEVQSSEAQEAEQEDANSAYRRLQSDYDRVAHQSKGLESENADLKEKMKRYMDAEEREKFELAEELAQERAKREQLELGVRQERAKAIEAEVFNKHPELKVFSGDLDFTGMSLDEAMEYAKETGDQLGRYVDALSQAEQQRQTGAPPAESAKSKSVDIENISKEDFKKLPAEERRKILEAKGLY